jgi:hypothetical protein
MGQFLACAFFFFAGGKAYNISVMVGISYPSLFESIDCVISAVKQCGKMEIYFLSNHDGQRGIVGGICLKFPLTDTNCYVSTVDGIM